MRVNGLFVLEPADEHCLTEWETWETNCGIPLVVTNRFHKYSKAINVWSLNEVSAPSKKLGWGTEAKTKNIHPKCQETMSDC